MENGLGEGREEDDDEGEDLADERLLQGVCGLCAWELDIAFFLREFHQLAPGRARERVSEGGGGREFMRGIYVVSKLGEEAGPLCTIAKAGWQRCFRSSAL